VTRRVARSLAFFAAVFFAALAVYSIDTTIQGARMELVDKGKEVLFSGGVKLVRGTDTMLAREMRTNQTRDKVNVKGNVRLTREASSTDTWKAFGDLGFYNTKDGTGYLIGTAKRAHVTRTEVVTSTITRLTEIFADRIDFVREGQRAFARGNVYGKTVDPKTGDVYEFQSAEADHFGDDGRVVLRGGPEQPVITSTGPKGTRRVTGKTLIYYIDARRLVSTENAEAVVHEVREEKKK
jgi:lipopolysaccharide export system protein LptA